MEDDIWRWFWVALAAILIVGEAFTLTFFLIPFAIGAAITAVLAFAGFGPVVQLAAFTIVSLVFLPLLRRYARHQDSERPLRAVGAERYIGQLARVIEPIDPATGTGQVRAETEEWRAVTREHRDLIPIGESVRVLAVDGTRLVVEPVTQTTATTAGGDPQAAEPPVSPSHE